MFGDPARKTLNFSVFPGDHAASAEEIAAEVNKALDRIAVGDFDVGELDTPPHSGRPQVDVRV